MRGFEWMGLASLAAAAAAGVAILARVGLQNVDTVLDLHEELVGRARGR